MKERDTYFKGESDKDFVIASMKEYFYEKQEMDKFLEEIITPHIKDKNLKLVDVSCGIGHILQLLNNISPTSYYLGIDQTRYLIEEAKKLSVQKNIEFKVADAYDIPSEYE